MPTALLALALLLSLPAHAQDAQASQRAPSAQESGSFDTFYRSTLPADAVAQAPVFAVTRLPGQREWQVAATVDGTPYRGAGALCRMTQDAFAYNPRARAGQRWSKAAQHNFAWLDRARCGKPARPVALWQHIPDAELAPLIEQHGVLLLRARLLFAGNTSCAPHRSLRFRLVAVDVSAPPYGKEELYSLVFDSETTARARIWVRKRGAELNAWDVGCGHRVAPG